MTRSRRAVAHAAPETPDPSPEPAAGSDMGTMTNEERERRILAMEEELRLLKGTYRPRSHKNKRPMAPSAPMAAAGRASLRPRPGRGREGSKGPSHTRVGRRARSLMGLVRAGMAATPLLGLASTATRRVTSGPTVLSCVRGRRPMLWKSLRAPRRGSL